MQSIAPTPLTRAEAISHVKNLLLQYFRDQVAKGAQIIEYKELDDLISDDVRKSYRTALTKVRNILLKDYGIALTTIHKRGFKVLPDEDKATVASAEARKKIGSATQSWRTQHDAIDASRLTSQQSINDYAKECLRLSIQEDINSGRQELKVQAALESAQNNRNAISDKEIRQYLYKAHEELRKIGAG